MILGKKLAIIMAHPDDETLGCGGLLAKRKEFGHLQTGIMLMTGGTAARGTDNDNKRHIDCLNALAVFGLHSCDVDFHQFPDNQMDLNSVLKYAKAVEEFLDSVNPEVVITHHGGDVNIDHRMTHQAVMTACRPWRYPGIKAILSAEIPSSTECAPSGFVQYRPNYFVELSAENIADKCWAFEKYEQEGGKPPHPRNECYFEALATIRGGEGGYEFAEGYQIERMR